MLKPSLLQRVLLIWWTLFGHYRKHPAQGLFLLLGLSLGVAILLGTLIVSSVAKTSFTNAQQIVGGSVIATIQPVNGKRNLPQSTYTSLRRNGFTNLIPMAEGRLKLKDGGFISLQGIDAFALAHSTSGDNATQTQGIGGFGQADFSMLAFSFPPYQTLISKSQAKQRNLKDGDILTLANGKTLPAIKVVSDSLGTGYSLMCDLACAQQMLSLPGHLTSIAVTKQPDDVEQLKALLSEDTELRFPSKTAQNAALSDAFFLNLTAVSFLAFLVGCFIAFNAVRFSVRQRLNMVQQLRLVGVTFGEIAMALMIELLSWALLASFIGCLLGWLIASALLPDVGLTLVRLFQGQNPLFIEQMTHWWPLALMVALTATLIATAQPFWQLAKEQPLQSRQIAQSKSQMGYAGIALLALGGLLTLMPHSQSLGFVIAACWFIGGAMLVPATLVYLYGVLANNKRLVNYPKLQWVVTDGKQNHGRFSVAMMAFTVAISAGIAVTTMVSSFRVALEDYLEQALAEDLYLQPDIEQVIDIKAFLDQRQDVALAYRYFYTSGAISTTSKIDNSVKGLVRGVTDHQLRHDSISLEKQVDNLWPRFHMGEGILINQTLAFQQQLKPGDKLSIKAKARWIEVEVLGIYYSYGSTFSAFSMDQNWLKILWPAVNTVEIGVFLNDGQSIEPLLNTLQDRFKVQSHQSIKPQEMKKIALTLFEQTFMVTQVMILFTLLIAAIGIYCACYAAELDKQRQLTLLKVLGVNNREIAGLSMLQLCFNAIVASLIALPLGIIIAWASVHIVLQYSFGWHFAIQIEASTLSIIIISAVMVALLSGLLPLYQLSRKTVINAFREAV